MSSNISPDKLIAFADLWRNHPHPDVLPILRLVLENQVALNASATRPNEFNLARACQIQQAHPALQTPVTRTWEDVLGVEPWAAALLVALTILPESEAPERRAEVLERLLQDERSRHIENLSLHGATAPVFQQLSRAAPPPGFHELSVDFELPHEDPLPSAADAFAHSEWAGRLRQLAFCQPLPDTAVFKSLWQSGVFPELRALKLGDLTGDMVNCLGQHVPSHLESLTVGWATNPSEVLEHIAGCEPLGSQLVHFKVEGGVTTPGSMDDGVRALSSGERFPALRILCLPGALHYLSENGVAALCRAGFRSSLRVLALPTNSVADRGLQRIASAGWERLEELDLSDNELTCEGIEELCAGEALPQLRRLKLNGNPIGDEGLQTLSTWGCLRHVEHIELRDCGVSHQGLAAFVDSNNVRAVHTLDLAGNRVGPEGAQALSLSPHLPCLTSLHLSANPIGAKGFRALARSGLLTRLAAVGVSGCQLDDSGVQDADTGTESSELRYLDASYNDLTHRGAERMLRAPWSQGLWMLSLSHNHRFGNQGLQALADAQSMTQLNYLDVVACGITTNAGQRIDGSKTLGRLAAFACDVEQFRTLLTRNLPLSGPVFRYRAC